MSFRSIVFPLLLTSLTMGGAFRLNKHQLAARQKLGQELASTNAVEDVSGQSGCPWSGEWIFGPESPNKQDLRAFGSSMISLEDKGLCAWGKLRGDRYKIGAPNQGGYDARGFKVKSRGWFGVNCSPGSQVFTCEGSFTYVHNYLWDPFDLFSWKRTYIELKATHHEGDVKFEVREATLDLNTYAKIWKEWQPMRKFT